MTSPLNCQFPSYKMSFTSRCIQVNLSQGQTPNTSDLPVVSNNVIYSYCRLCEGKPTRMRRLCLKTSEPAAYALTIPLLGFKCTWYYIKSGDMNEKGKDFMFYNKPYMLSAGLHGPLHMAMVCALCPCSLLPAPTL